MFVKERTHLLARCLAVLTFIISTDCGNSSVYICDTTEITAIETPINLVDTRALLYGTHEAASCTALVKYMAGQTILVTLNASLSVISCDAENYVQFSDEAHTSPKYCNGQGGATLFVSQKSPMTLTYMSNHRQSFMNISIAPAFCLPPPAILNGWYMASDTRYAHSSTIKYACRTGYELSVNRTRQCIVENEERLIWSGVTPSCNAIDCGRPTIGNAHFTSPLNTSYGAEIQFFCGDSRVPREKRTARCLADKRWTDVSSDLTSKVFCGAETQTGRVGSLTYAEHYGIMSASVVVGVAITFTAAFVVVLVDKKKKRADRLTKHGANIKLQVA